MSASNADAGKVFVSYSRADSKVVQAICAELKLRGLSIWIDQNEILPGDELLERLNSGLNDCKLFIAFVGGTYFQNGRYTSAEFGAAFHKARSAENWRIITVRLLPDIELPPLVASNIFIDHTTPGKTADAIVRSVAKAEAWDGPVFRSRSAENSSPQTPADIADIGDRDLEIVTSSFLNAVPSLLRTCDEFVSFKITLPRKRRLAITVLRVMAENEGVMLNLRGLLDHISIKQRFIAKFSSQIDEGFLGRFEVAVELQLERAQSDLAEARSKLRHEFEELVEVARIEQLVVDATP